MFLFVGDGDDDIDEEGTLIVKVLYILVLFLFWCLYTLFFDFQKYNLDFSHLIHLFSF